MSTTSRTKHSLIKPSVVFFGLLVFLYGLSTASWAASATLTDVPANHSARSAVQLLVDKGYFSVGQDGTFKGTQAVDRYTLAVALAQLLDEVSESGLGEQDAAVLARLLDEYHAELVRYYTEQGNMASQLKQEALRNEALTEQISRLLSSVDTLKNQSSYLQASLASLQLEMTNYQGAVQNDLAGLEGSLEKQAASSAAQADGLKLQLSALSASVSGDIDRLNLLQQQLAADLESLREVQEQADSAIRTEAQVLVNNMRLALQDSDAKLAQRADNLHVRTTNVEDSVSTLNKDLQTSVTSLNSELAASVDSLSKEIQSLQSQIASLSSSMGGTIGSLQTEITAQDSALGEVQLLVNNRLAEQYAVFHSLVEDLSAEVANNVADMESKFNAALNDLNTRLNQLSADLVTQQKENTVQSEQIAGLQADVAATKEDLSATETALDKKVADVSAQAESSAKQNDAAIQKNAADIGGLQTQVKEHEMQITALERATFAAVADTEAVLEANLKEVDSGLSILIGQVRGVTAQNSTDIGNLQDATKGNADSIHELTGVVQVNAADIAQLQAASGQQSGHLSELQGTVDSHGEQLKTHSEQLTALEKAAFNAVAESEAGLLAANTNLAQQIANVEGGSNENASSIQELQNGQKENASNIGANKALIVSLQADVASQSQRLNEVKQEILAAVAALNEETKASQQVLATNMASQLAQAEAAWDSKLKDALDQTRTSYELRLAEQQALHQAEVAGLMEQIGSLTNALDATKKDVEQLRTMVLNAESQIGLSESQMQQLENAILGEASKASIRTKLQDAELSSLNDQIEAFKTEAGQEAASARKLTWGLAALAAVLGILVQP